MSLDTPPHVTGAMHREFDSQRTAYDHDLTLLPFGRPRSPLWVFSSDESSSLALYLFQSSFVQNLTWGYCDRKNGFDFTELPAGSGARDMGELMCLEQYDRNHQCVSALTV